MKYLDRPLIGWREWVCLPGLGIARLKAKIDTGARTSCLHAFKLQQYHVDGQLMVSFAIHPLQGILKEEIYSEAPVYDERLVTDSGGHAEDRFVIMTDIIIGDQQWPIEMTLTNRDTMKFRMLLGRTGLKERFFVVPDASYLTGNRPPKRKHKSNEEGL
ncbi:MAG: ATP-dependent zinc protease [Gammaproteobacteria bacterium]|nr:RimK/LysX family protein [Gammaproteobacteria bacterium]NNJ98104.1 ATP-dependent zinc protease [Gammaproteobacteria bacterium]